MGLLPVAGDTEGGDFIGEVGELLEHFITAVVTMGIIYRLKVVDIHDKK